MIDFRSKTVQELESFMESIGEAAFRGRQLFKWCWRPGVNNFSQITEFSKQFRQKLNEYGFLYSLNIADKKVSKDGTTKWAFKLRDDHIIESVLIPERTHFTLCVSTQVGCAMGCRFCRTGLMGFKRNLTPSEIALQPLKAMEEMENPSFLRNIVFMGMGEPLANFENLISAIHILTSDLGLNFSTRKITVSTCGIAPKIIELGKRTDVGLAISLHATTDEIRNKIMPINKKYNLDALLTACKNFPLPKRRRITFEYILLRGINDSELDAKRLAKLLRPIPSKINLIPFNESEGIKFKTPPEEDVLRFQNILKKEGYTAIVRKSKGRDIKAACGQLCHENLHAA